MREADRGEIVFEETGLLFSEGLLVEQPRVIEETIVMANPISTSTYVIEEVPVSIKFYRSHFGKSPLN